MGPVGSNGASPAGDVKALARFKAREVRVEIVWKEWD